ncbi:hypothetical protein RM704_39195 [Streptomyces sp. DSM 3412]|uniref:Transposase n=1 Tax=Streptomyces gottesmaniae TaxID=3075518 RepID=A0ABU2ZAK9_9ACTN|nr:hypothetical protein [Streptomyces sp. DSM 3412]MDT0573405.1 hypothetical protein [Streptomyces sp. DSM 3412]
MTALLVYVAERIVIPVTTLCGIDPEPCDAREFGEDSAGHGEADVGTLPAGEVAQRLGDMRLQADHADRGKLSALGNRLTVDTSLPTAP